MRADGRARSRVGGALRVVAIALLSAWPCAGCRSTSGAGPASLEPSLQAALSSAESTDMAALPDGAAKEVVTGRCLLCHGAALITQQHKDAASWGRSVTQMRAWGAPLQDEEQAALVAYLAEHFGTDAARR